MNYYIIAGESSGDLHASNLIKCLKTLDEHSSFRGWGGDLMSMAGAALVTHYKNMAFMGFLEVVKNIKTIFRYLSQCKADIMVYKPDVLILIDYPGFNMRIAKWAKNKGIPVVYYITPQVWAWHKSRAYTLERISDLRLVILPFEEDFFNTMGIKATYVGHPLLDAIHQYKSAINSFNLKSKYPLLYKIALLPGSRKQEIETVLPIMLKAVSGRNAEIWLSCVSHIPLRIYQDIVHKVDMRDTIVHYVVQNTYALLSSVDLAVVTSGTATLETALFDVPMIVCYKGSAISYAIAKRLVQLKHISLVNLILDKAAVPELIQDDLTPENIIRWIDKIKSGGDDTMKQDYTDLYKRLGGEGASLKAAGQIVNLIAHQ